MPAVSKKGQAKKNNKFITLPPFKLTLLFRRFFFACGQDDSLYCLAGNPGEVLKSEDVWVSLVSKKHKPIKRPTHW